MDKFIACLLVVFAALSPPLAAQPAPFLISLVIAYFVFNLDD